MIKSRKQLGCQLCCKNVLGNKKIENCEQLVVKILQAPREMIKTSRKILQVSRDLGFNMGKKHNFINKNLDRFPDNLGDASEEQEELFYQNLTTIEYRYQQPWDKRMIAFKV